MYSIGWFSSGRGPGSRSLLTAMQESIAIGEVQARIAFVFCNREVGFSPETDLFLDLVKSYNLPLVCYSSRKFRENRESSIMSTWREEYDRGIMQRLAGFDVDLSVLAGYMLITEAEMCRRYTMINLHPATPGGPKGTWREVIWKLIEERAKRTGVMMHLVTPELDEGPPLSYCTFSIRGEPFERHWESLKGRSTTEIKAREGERNELFQLIRQHGLKREHPLIIRTVKACSEGRIQIRNGQVLDSAGKPISGYELSEEIDRLITTG